LREISEELSQDFYDALEYVSRDFKPTVDLCQQRLNDALIWLDIRIENINENNSVRKKAMEVIDDLTNAFDSLEFVSEGIIKGKYQMDHFDQHMVETQVDQIELEISNLMSNKEYLEKTLKSIDKIDWIINQSITE